MRSYADIYPYRKLLFMYTYTIYFYILYEALVFFFFFFNAHDFDTFYYPLYHQVGKLLHSRVPTCVYII